MSRVRDNDVIILIVISLISNGDGAKKERSLILINSTFIS